MKDTRMSGPYPITVIKYEQNMAMLLRAITLFNIISH